MIDPKKLFQPEEVVLEDLTKEQRITRAGMIKNLLSAEGFQYLNSYAAFLQDVARGEMVDLDPLKVVFASGTIKGIGILRMAVDQIIQDGETAKQELQAEIDALQGEKPDGPVPAMRKTPEDHSLF